MSQDVIWARFDVPNASFKGGRSGEGGSIVADSAELANLSKKKTRKKKHTVTPNNVTGHCLGLFFNVPDVSFEGGWSREGGSVIGDGAELAVVVVVGD